MVVRPRRPGNSRSRLGNNQWQRTKTHVAVTDLGLGTRRASPWTVDAKRSRSAQRGVSVPSQLLILGTSGSLYAFGGCGRELEPPLSQLLATHIVCQAQGWLQSAWMPSKATTMSACPSMLTLGSRTCCSPSPQIRHRSCSLQRRLRPDAVYRAERGR